MAAIAAKTRSHSRRRNERRGVVTVELAVCLPVITLFVLGTIEAANAIFVQQALTSAAYEGANVASAVGSNEQKATAAASQVLAAMGVTGATITVTPQVTPQTPVGTHVQVTC